MSEIIGYCCLSLSQLPTDLLLTSRAQSHSLPVDSEVLTTIPLYLNLMISVSLHLAKYWYKSDDLLCLDYNLGVCYIFQE